MLISFDKSSSASEGSFLDTADLKISVPYLSDPAPESVVPDAKTIKRSGERTDLDNDISIFHAQIPASRVDIEESAYKYFSSLFANLGNRYLYRNWTYMPRINEGGGDRENYRRFCSGRSRAYEERFASNPEGAMAAGTCVGCDGESMTVVTIAGASPPNHFENPNQVPAYRYPREYGPRSPSFARATAATFGSTRYRFISGTAAVLGHRSMGVGSIETQIAVTADNLETIARQTLSDASELQSTRSFGKVYLRHAKDYPFVKGYLQKRFPQWSDSLIFLRSDICREDLLIEAELTFIDLLS